MAGHFNPMESISDKLPSLLQFFPYVPLHVTRSMHWDSDHVVLFEDSIKDIAAEVVRCPEGMDKVLIGMDFFDASINRIALGLPACAPWKSACCSSCCSHGIA